MRAFHLLLSFILFSVFTSQARALDQTKGWTHLELGAANYGANPPKSREIGLRGPVHEDQYRILFDTVEALVAQRGPKGTFYINDLDASDTHFAAEKLRAYLRGRGYTSVTVEERAGDFTKIDLPKVQSAHIKNPEKGLFYEVDMSRSLQKIADLTESGLEIQTYHETQMRDQLDGKLARLSERQGDGNIYYFPNGKIVREKNGKLKGQPRIPGRYIVAPSTSKCGVASELTKLIAHPGS